MDLNENFFELFRGIAEKAYLKGVEDARRMTAEDRKPLSTAKEICDFLSINSTTTLREKFRRGDYGNSLTMNGKQYYFFPEEFKKFQMQNYEFLLKK